MELFGQNNDLTNKILTKSALQFSRSKFKPHITFLEDPYSLLFNFFPQFLPQYIVPYKSTLYSAKK